MRIGFITVFGIAYTGTMQLRTFIDGALRPIMPEFSRLGGIPRAEGATRARELARRASRLTWQVGAPLYLFCALAAPQLLQAWLGSRLLPVQVPIFRIMLVGSFLSALAVPGYYILVGVGSVRTIVGSHAVQTFLSLLLQLAAV